MDLIRSEHSYQLLVGSITDYAIYMLDLQGHIISWNAGAERIKGYTAEEVLGQHFQIFYTDEDRAAGRPHRALGLAAQTGRYEEEGWRVRKDGSRLLASVVIDPVHDDDGRLVGFAKITRDVTEKKSLERQLAQAQKMEAVGQLSGGIAHDFNNILSVIVGNLDMLLEDLPEGGKKTLASEALEAAENGAELVRQLLAFSRNQALLPETLDVRTVLSRTEPILRRTLGECIQMDFKCQDEVWSIRADPGQLESAILNLAINARDAMPEGGKLVIRCTNVRMDHELARQEDLPIGDFVVLKIADSGTGIAEDVIDRIFEPFFTTKEVGKGSGLGLSMVYGFAKQSGGTVKIYSEPGHGTEVRVYLPRAAAKDECTTESPPVVVPSAKGERVLLVEDREDVRKFAARCTKSLGYDVVEADCAEAALKLVNGGFEFDLLLTDVIMPGQMNGLDLAWELRKRRPDLPIVLTSGFSDPTVIAKDLGALGATLLPKPFRKADLSTVLSEALSKWRKTSAYGSN